MLVISPTVNDMEAKRRQIHEQQVLEQELKSLRKDAAVYKQQQNSQIFFRNNVDKMMSECKKTMDNLVGEYKSLEEQDKTDSQQAGDNGYY